jgi:hypothetical protein
MYGETQALKLKGRLVNFSKRLKDENNPKAPPNTKTPIQANERSTRLSAKDVVKRQRGIEKMMGISITQ